VLDADSAFFKVDIFHSQSQGFTYPATQAKKETDKQTVTQIVGLILEEACLA
jgi:hypothetical protein